MFNPRLPLFTALAAVLLMSGCQMPAPVVIREPAPTTGAQAANREADMARILELKSRGVITDAQALEIMQAMLSGQQVALPAASSPAPAPTASSSVSAPSQTTSQPPAAAAQAPAAPSTVPAALNPEVKSLDARYQPSVALQGRLRSIGSDTMDLMVASWERVFLRYHPSLRVLHEGRGSSTAVPALIEGQSDIGPMSRALQDPEKVKFKERFGYEPTEIRVAIDALGVYVHPDNPLAKTGLTLAQLDAIFSASRKRGAAEQIVTWGQLGLGAEWASAPIRVYGRNRASGTYGYFRDTALSKGEFGPWVEEQASSQMVVAKVEADRFGIGYSGVGYKTDGVVMMPLAKTAGGAMVSAGEETALNGSYPLARALYLVINRAPATKLGDLPREFLSFALGPIGQELVKQEGYYPLPASVVSEELAKLR